MKHSLERKDNLGHYAPENCAWATQKQQCRNMERTIRLTHNGETKSLAEWAERAGLPYQVAYKRYRRGKSVNEILAPMKGV